MFLYKTLTLLAVATISVQAYAGHSGCDIKKANIEKQIHYARLHGNIHREAGLQTALKKINTYCTEGSLDQKHQDRIREKQLKIEERQRELIEAQATGKKEKILKKERKLEEARKELAETMYLHSNR